MLPESLFMPFWTTPVASLLDVTACKASTVDVGSPDTSGDAMVVFSVTPSVLLALLEVRMVLDDDVVDVENVDAIVISGANVAGAAEGAWVLINENDFVSDVNVCDADKELVGAVDVEDSALVNVVVDGGGGGGALDSDVVAEALVINVVAGGKLKTVVDAGDSSPAGDAGEAGDGGSAAPSAAPCASPGLEPTLVMLGLSGLPGLSGLLGLAGLPRTTSANDLFRVP